MWSFPRIVVLIPGGLPTLTLTSGVTQSERRCSGDSTANAGFTTGTPWLPLASDYANLNVFQQLADDKSTLAFYKTLLSLRRKRLVLTKGSLSFIDGLASDLLAYVRAYEGERLMVILNFGAETQQVGLEDLAADSHSLHSTTFGRQSGLLITLAPHESILLALN